MTERMKKKNDDKMQRKVGRFIWGIIAKKKKKIDKNYSIDDREHNFALHCDS